MVDNVVFLVHGVMSDQKLNWTDKFSDKIKNDISFKGWSVEKGKWGYLFFLFSIFPFIKKSKVKEITRQLEALRRKYPTATIHIIAHSYGTLLIHEAIKKSNISIRNLILVGGILDQTEDFSETLKTGKIKNIFNFCSYKDIVIKWQFFFGKCGYWGFNANNNKTPILKPYKDLSVKNYRFNVKHSEYFSDTPPDFYILWRQLLRL